jgi:hypothetical protein
VCARAGPGPGPARAGLSRPELGRLAAPPPRLARAFCGGLLAPSPSLSPGVVVVRHGAAPRRYIRLRQRVRARGGRGGAPHSVLPSPKPRYHGLVSLLHAIIYTGRLTKSAVSRRTQRKQAKNPRRSWNHRHPPQADREGRGGERGLCTAADVTPSGLVRPAW